MTTTRLKGKPVRKEINFDPFSRALPQCPDAERVTISYILNKPELMNLVFGMLKPSDFGDPLHQNIYQAFYVIHKNKKHIDTLSVSVWLQDNGFFDKGGDLSVNTEDPRITALFELTKDDENYDFMSYANRVKQWSSRRKLINTLRRNLDECYENDSPQDLIDTLTKEILKIQTAEAEELTPLKDSVETFRKKLFRPMEERSKSAASTGFAGLDNLLNGINPSTVTAIMARSKVGKSLTAMQMVMHEARTTEFASIYFLLEMDKDLIVHRLLQQMTGLPIQKMMTGRVPMTPGDELKINQALDELKRLDIHLVDEKCNNVAQMRSYLYRFRAKNPDKKIGWIVADHWNLFEGSGETGKQEENAIQFNELVKEFKARGLLPAQCRKPQNGDEKRPPTVHDVLGSSALLNICTNMLVLHRPNKGTADSQVGDWGTITVAAARSANDGSSIEVWFDPTTITLSEKTRGVDFKNIMPKLNLNFGDDEGW